MIKQAVAGLFVAGLVGCASQQVAQQFTEQDYMNAAIISRGLSDCKEAQLIASDHYSKGYFALSKIVHTPPFDYAHYVEVQAAASTPVTGFNYESVKFCSGLESKINDAVVFAENLPETPVNTSTRETEGTGEFLRNFAAFMQGMANAANANRPTTCIKTRATTFSTTTCQ